MVRDTVLGMPDEWSVSLVADGLDAVHLGTSHPFDILVLDLRFPVIDGYSAAAGICTTVEGELSTAPAVILVAAAVHELPASLPHGGIQIRVVFRDSPPELVRSALGWAADVTRDRPPPAAPAAGGQARTNADLPRTHGPHDASLLSARERQVLVSLCLGQSNRQLASALSVTEATVKTHVSRLLAKLGLASRVEAVVFAYENGIVVPGDRHRSA